VNKLRARVRSSAVISGAFGGMYGSGCDESA
jgi:hypothetical protein